MAHGGAAAAIARAIKASGVIVRVDPEVLADILRRTEKPLVVYSRSRIFGTTHQYLTSYKGLAFLTKSREQIDLPRGAEILIANKIWVP